MRKRNDTQQEEHQLSSHAEKAKKKSKCQIQNPTQHFKKN
jgi:hypothetical protein